MDGAAEEGTPFVPARGSRRVMFTPLIAAGVILVASLCGLNAQQSTAEAERPEPKDSCLLGGNSPMSKEKGQARMRVRQRENTFSTRREARPQ